MRVYFQGHKKGLGKVSVVEHTLEVDRTNPFEAREDVIAHFQEQGVTCVRCFAVVK